jgi:diguanylate cyclase (GGDEF)-like protein
MFKRTNVMTSLGHGVVHCVVAMLLLSALGLATAKETTSPKIRVQLKWFHQFQFAGYYAAQSQGYYRDAGMEVELIEGPSKTPVQQAVLEGHADFGVQDGGELLYQRLQGAPVVALAVLYQHSPQVLISRKFRHPAELVGHTIALSEGRGEAQIMSMIRKEGVKADAPSIRYVPFNWSYQPLIDRSVDAAVAYLTDISRLQNVLGFRPAVMDPRDFGVDFYGDTLFTSEALLNRNPELVDKFRRASLKGWAYAMDHPKEMSELIHKLPSQRSSGPSTTELMAEAAAMDPLVLPQLVELGNMNPGRWLRMAETYRELGFISREPVLDGFIYTSNPEATKSRKLLQIFAAILGALTVITGISIVWIRSLRFQVAQRTQELAKAAHYDALTGVPNRFLLSDRMKVALANAKRSDSYVAVCYVDLDGFKAINDSRGHETGDRVLIEIGKRLQSVIRSGDTVGRLGGDEFVLLLVGMNSIDECVHGVERILLRIAEPIQIDDRSFSITASVGVALFPGDVDDADSLLRHADQAMYTAKQAGKNQYSLYDRDHGIRAQKQRLLAEQIRIGIDEEQFELYYQPKIDLRTRQLVGAEALIRWNHPEQGLVPPGEFLGLIAASDLDIRLGNWVIESATRAQKKWREAGFDIQVSVNITPHHLQSLGFSDHLHALLQKVYGDAACNLQLEILETASLDDVVKVRGILNKCRAFGVSFALDDFGTGYSSLSYLGALPIDTIKIDQSFVRNILTRTSDRNIVEAVIALSQTFQRHTVAEGIETYEICEALAAMNCQTGQGYAIGRPMPLATFMQWTLR